MLTRRIEGIRTKRTKIANFLTSAAMREYRNYGSCMEKNRTVCQVTDEGSPCKLRGACDTFSLGAIMRCLIVCELWPTTQDTSWSIRRIVEHFPHMEIFSRSFDTKFAKRHHACGAQPRLRLVVAKVLSGPIGLQLSRFCQSDES